ncbi:MAG TPA: hypothetical protein VHZ75_02305 [Solirubrobacteraceae bacterium]|nr:hypothetical protein [Solirubrobacteraceae bacterium]
MAEADSTTAGQVTTMTGDGNQPAGVGYAPPDTGFGEGAESEVPVGVEAVEASDIPTGDEVPEAAADGFDVSSIVADAGDDGGAADETGDEAPLKTDAKAQVGADT